MGEDGMHARNFMSDIFISYAHSDRARAQNLAKALEQHGWSVWWDPRIPPGKIFDEVIEKALNAAKCVVVLWSKNSVTSDWVKAEATEGKKRKILVPVLIDDVEIPLEFRRIQAASLVEWKETSTNQEYNQLLEAIAAILGKSVAQKISPFSESKMHITQDKQRKTKIKKVTIWATIPFIFLVFIGIYFLKYNYSRKGIKNQSTISDLKHNLIGDQSRTFVDIVQCGMILKGSLYTFNVIMDDSFPSPKVMKDKRIDIILHIDIDCDSNTGQTSLRNDYNIHLYLNEHGWYSSWYKVSQKSKHDGIRINMKEFRIDVKGNKASLSFPKFYLPSNSFEWCVSSSTGNSVNWHPPTSNLHTPRATFNIVGKLKLKENSKLVTIPKNRDNRKLSKFYIGEPWGDEWAVITYLNRIIGGGEDGGKERFGWKYPPRQIGGAVPPEGAWGGVLYLHPITDNSPAIIEGRFKIYKPNLIMRLRVSGNMYCDGAIPEWKADWRLRVKINGVDLGSYIIDGGWRFIDFPLYSYYNKWVTINILCEATGWYFEHVFIDDIEFIQAQ
jgi:hypothetical protein